MNLCIDIGNTLIKVAIFDNDNLIYFDSFSELSSESVKKLHEKYPFQQGIISSVREDNNAFTEETKPFLKKLIVLNASTKTPIVNEYQTPETLGKDRLAAVIGANYLYPGKNILVVDAGSAITFDFINNKGEYKGGNIAPGLTMRFKALHQFTSRLPLLSSDDNMPLLGRNTTEAITAGVQNSIIFETDTYINELSKVYQGMITVFTGGDAKFFDNKLKNTIFVIPNLVLIGLNRILNFNA